MKKYESFINENLVTKFINRFRKNNTVENNITGDYWGDYDELSIRFRFKDMNTKKANNEDDFIELLSKRKLIAGDINLNIINSKSFKPAFKITSAIETKLRKNPLDFIERMFMLMEDINMENTIEYEQSCNIETVEADPNSYFGGNPSWEKKEIWGSIIVLSLDLPNEARKRKEFILGLVKISGANNS